MMFTQSRRLGDARVFRVLEYSAPTHDPSFLFPDLAQDRLDAAADWLGPAHYIAHMNKLIVTIQIWGVEIGDKLILIDTGVGNAKPRGVPRMAMLNNRVLEWLEAAGAAPDRVTHVVSTHLHVDHVGWNTVRDGAGWRPTFPNAEYIVPRKEYAHYEELLAEGSDPLVEESWTDSVVPVMEAGQMTLFDEETDTVADILRPEAVPGHTVGMTGYRIGEDDEEGFFCADVFHSPVQIAHPEINTAYCALPEVARTTRARVLSEAADRGTLLMPMHFGAPYCGHVRRQGEGYRFEGADWPET
jgi:glyoxylase-like metal-dependent hydrolase (beta-lactamase superfamily II)